MATGIIAVLVIILLGLSFYLRSPQVRGKQGEQSVQRLLGRLNSEEYVVLHDLLIRYGNRTAQIDHVVLSRYGVVVIETKNYTGWIFGGETDRIWTLTNYKQKYEFYNPVLQNKTHVRALKTVLKDCGDLVYQSVVVFHRQAELKQVYTETPVIHVTQLLKFIRYYSTPLLSQETINQAARVLRQANITDKKIRQEHIQRVRQRKTGARGRYR